MQECTHPTTSQQSINLRLFMIGLLDIGGAGCLANFQSNAPTALFAIFFDMTYCICSQSSCPLWNYNFLDFLGYNDLHPRCHRFGEPDMKICQCNAKPKDVNTPFLHPSRLCGNNTSQFCKLTKKFYIHAFYWNKALDNECTKTEKIWK